MKSHCASDAISDTVVCAQDDLRLEDLGSIDELSRVSHIAVLAGNRLRGVVEMSRLLLLPRGRILADLLDKFNAPPTVRAEARLDEVNRILDEGSRDFVVVENRDGEYLGTITSQSLLRALLGWSRELAVEEEKQAELKFLSLLDAVPDAMLVLDEEGVVVQANAPADMLFGRVDSGLRQLRFETLVTTASRDRYRALREQCLADLNNSATGSVIELSILRKDGTEVPCDLSLNILRGSSSNHLVVAIRDVSLRKQAEAAQAESLRFSLATLDALSAYVAVVDATGDIVATNKAWRDFARSDTATWQIVSEDANYLAVCDVAAETGNADAAAMAEGIREVFAEERDTWFHEYDCHESDKERWFYCRITRCLANGVPYAVVAHENITALRRAEEQLEQSVARYESLSRASPVGIVMFDSTGKCVDVNQRWCQITGRRREDALGDGWHEDIHSDDRLEVVRRWAEAVKGSREFYCEYRLRGRKGRTTWVIGEGRQAKDSRGKVIGYIGTVTDVTHQKQTEEALRSLTTELASLGGAAFYEGVVLRFAELVNCEMAFICRPRTNDSKEVVTIAMCADGEIKPNVGYALAGTPCEHVYERRSWVVPHSAWKKYRFDAFLTEQRVEAYVGVSLIDDQDRQVGHIGVMSREPLESPNTVEMIANLFALSVVAEMQRQTSERRFADLFEFSPDAIVITDEDGIIVQANRQVANVLGWKPQELVGRSVEVLMPGDVRTLHTSLRRDYLKTPVPRAMGSGRNDLLGLRKDGTVFPVDISLSPLESPEGVLVAAAVRDVTERRKVLMELHSLTEELQRSNAVIESERASLADRVAQRTAELERVNAELVKASEAKSEFLSTMSHELRTPLNGILGMNELLLTTDLNERQREYVEACSSSGKVLMQLVNNILDLSKIEAGKLELDLRESDLEALVYDTAEIMSHVARAKGLFLNCRITAGASVVAMCDDNRLRQILINLIGNATKFTPSGGITVMLDRVAKRDGIARLRFEVSDTGMGIPTERLDRLFKTFSQVDSSTTRQFGGTGLGLAICKNLVELMGGEIGVTSQVGVGTTFWFEIDMEVRRTLSIEERGRRLLGGTRILAVDGLDRERQQLADCLTSWHCDFEHVAAMGDALAAIRTARNAGKPFRIVLADCRVLTGDEFSQVYDLASFADLDVIGLGCPTDDLSREHLRGLGLRHVLADPIRPSALFNALTSVLSIATVGETREERPPTPRRPTAKTRTGHLLVAEDNQINQLYIAELLKHLGYTSEVVSNGEEVLSRIEQERYDLILMDCQMPEMDGFAAAREIRRREEAGERSMRMPIIALTANALKGDREKCLAAGMDEYVSKPVKVEQLRDVLEQYLG